jgi:hypothetical protein
VPSPQDVFVDSLMNVSHAKPVDFQYLASSGRQLKSSAIALKLSAMACEEQEFE